MQNIPKKTNEFINNQNFPHFIEQSISLFLKPFTHIFLLLSLLTKYTFYNFKN